MVYTIVQEDNWVILVYKVWNRGIIVQSPASKPFCEPFVAMVLYVLWGYCDDWYLKRLQGKSNENKTNSHEYVIAPFAKTNLREYVLFSCRFQGWLHINQVFGAYLCHFM